jgi:hypothetical protein
MREKAVIRIDQQTFGRSKRPQRSSWYLSAMFSKKLGLHFIQEKCHTQFVNNYT